MKRWFGALAFVSVTAVASTAMAQEVQIRGPLANAPSCRHCVLYRSGRFVIAPSYGISLQDEFVRQMFLGAQINYHIGDIFAIGAYGSVAPVHINTGLTQAVQDNTASPSQTDITNGAAVNPNVPVGRNFGQQVGTINWFIAAPQLTLIPLRGKLALFQNIFLDTDFYVFAAPAFIGISERSAFDAWNNGDSSMPRSSADLAANQIARSSRVAITGTFGVGLNFYITKFLSLSVEYRAYPFSWNTSGTDENTAARSCGANGMQTCSGSPDYLVQQRRVGSGSATAGGRFIIDGNDQAFHWNQMLNFSLNIFLPFQPRIGD